MAKATTKEENDGGNGNAMSCNVAKGLEPARVLVGEGVPLEEGCVERVGARLYDLRTRMNVEPR
jgi:hypothetical protein